MSSYAAVIDRGLNKNFFCFTESKISSVKKKLSVLVKKIESLARLIIETLAFPLRYFGAKTWSIPGLFFRLPRSLYAKQREGLSDEVFKQELFGSGYHYDVEELSREEVKPYLIYACANAAVHINKPNYVEPFGWREREGDRYFDRATGLKISLYEKGDSIIITFGALRSHDCELADDSEQKEALKSQGIGNAVKNLLGFVPSVYEEADEWMEKFLKDERFKGKKISLSGQCYGGSFASYLALKHQLPAVCMNTFPLGAGLQKEIGKEKLDQADKYVTQISIDNDYISDFPTVGVIDRVISAVGLRTPGNFGKRFRIPSAYSSMKSTHYYTLSSIISHLGYETRIHPKDLPEKFKAEVRECKLP